MRPRTPKRIGRYWRLDCRGCILNDADASLIGPAFEAAVDEAVSACRNNLGPNLHSVYLRGSIPRGLALPGISDMDIIALASAPTDSEDQAWIQTTEREIFGRHPQLTGVQIEFAAADDARDTGFVHEMPFVLKTQSVCLFGEDLTSVLPTYTPDAAVANIDIVQIDADITEARNNVRAPGEDRTHVKYWSSRIAKNMIRTGFSLIMLRENRFTRDLALCASDFGRHFPFRQTEMNTALNLALNPSEDPVDCLNLIDGFGSWLVGKANSWLAEHNPERLLAMKRKEDR
ncbi:MAG: nucleotidyltransferase domain-containing protein [Pseudomonadota bacterium]